MSSAAVVTGALRVKNHTALQGASRHGRYCKFITANEQTQSNQVFKLFNYQ